MIRHGTQAHTPSSQLPEYETPGPANMSEDDDTEQEKPILGKKTIDKASSSTHLQACGARFPKSDAVACFHHLDLPGRVCFLCS